MSTPKHTDTDANPKDIRESRGYLQAFWSAGYQLNEVPKRHFKELTEQIDHSLQNTSDARSKLVRSAYKKHIIPKENFEWIKTNDRACYWLWRKITARQADTLPKATTHIAPTSSNEERFDSIIEHFDLAPHDINTRQECLRKLRESWHYYCRFADDFSWLNTTGKTQLNWAWAYICSRPEIDTLNIEPQKKEERRKAIIGCIDAWYVHMDTKKLFLIKMKKSWAQKKYRDKQQDKKAYNFYLHPSTRKHLHELTERLQVNSSNETLEFLITRAYQEEVLTPLEATELQDRLLHLQRELGKSQAENKRLSSEIEQVHSQTFSSLI